MKIRSLLIAMGLMVSGIAHAGTPVYAVGEDLEKAIEAARVAVEKAARDANRCVSRYPSVETCVQLKDGRWRCHGIRANHKGSCH